MRWSLNHLLSIATYMRDGIGLQPEDHYWNVADPGWAYGMAYAVIGTLLLGHATTFHEAGFTVDGMMRVAHRAADHQPRRRSHGLPADDGGG